VKRIEILGANCGNCRVMDGTARNAAHIPPWLIRENSLVFVTETPVK
jgi:hypothetical protein